MMRPLIYVAVAALAVLAVRPAAAQPPPVPLVWEVVGDSVGRHLPESEGLFVAPDSAVYTIGLEILAVIRPGDPDWTVIIEDIRLPEDDIFVASTGAMFAVNSTLHRSDDGGRTWTWTGVDDVDVVFETPDGTLIANETDCCGIARSTDGGLSWDLVDLNDAMGFPYAPMAFEHLPTSAERPSGRLVAVGRGGAAYSNDGGLTWQPSNLAADFVWDSDHDSVVRSPVTGRLYAAIYGPAPDGGDPWGTIWESADGATWTYAGRIPSVRSTKPLQLKVAPDGVLWALDEGAPRTAWVWRSADEGRTWGRSERIDAVSLVGHELNYEELAV
ncbi:MAG: sialidase family protein, partial [Bacteroidota bacterium]